MQCGGRKAGQGVPLNLTQEQDDMYNSASLRARRAALPLTDRNIIFAVDSSGSIGRDAYTQVLQILGTFSYLFCGTSVLAW